MQRREARTLQSTVSTIVVKATISITQARALKLELRRRRLSGSASPYSAPSTSIHSMSVRRHIAAIALFGVQLLQGVLPAAGAMCERQAAASPMPALMSDAQPAAVTGSHHHHDTTAPAPAPAEHPQTPAACPMAMACTVVGVVSPTVVVSIVDVAIDVHRPVHAAAWPVSLDIAPEPPPPRG